MEVNMSYMSRYKRDEYVRNELLRVRREPSVRHIFNAGAYRLCTSPEDRDPEIERALDALAGDSEHTINRMKIIGNNMGYSGLIPMDSDEGQVLIEMLEDPSAGMEDVPSEYMSPESLDNGVFKSGGLLPSFLNRRR
jgi:hypothetical protein